MATWPSSFCWYGWWMNAIRWPSREKRGWLTQPAVSNSVLPIGYSSRDTPCAARGARCARGLAGAGARGHDEREGEVLRRLEALARRLLEAVQDDGLERRRLGAHALGEGRGVVVQDRGQGVERRAAVEGARAG